MESKPKKRIGIAIWCVVLVLCLLVNIFVTNYALSWAKVLTGYFGTIGGGTSHASETQDYATLEELTAAEKELELEIVEEGMVLLKNDNKALPLATGSKVSVFGQTAQMWMTKEKLSNTKDTVFLESLESAGLEINAALRKFYKQSKHTSWGNGANLGNGAIAGSWVIDEVPQSEYTDEVKNSYASYNDAAIVVITRGGSEGGDLPRYMDRFGGELDQSYLELSQNEKDLLTAVTASFDKVVLVLHTGNAMQMDFLNDYDIDAVVWISGTGQDGIEAVGKLFTGEINPSGRNVDTYVYDNFSAPAMQNFGDFRFTQNGNPIDAVTTTVGGTYSYLNYGESIYVGYKYYETRYEDVVMGTAGAGNYDYASTVAYPFGYGLSYTTFQWSNFKSSAPDADGNMTFSVDVTNTGDFAGKDVVQLYYQAPYTEYDIENGVEKASVNLLDFGKTKLLKPGESDTLDFTVNLYDMVSYDANGAKTYILDDGDYYVTLASDAHAAVNNILAAKGYSTSDGMTADGNADMVMVHTQSAFETCNLSFTGSEITNLFDDCVLPDAVYLSRSNWSVMDNDGLRYATGTLTGLSETTDGAGTVYTHEATQDIIDGLTSEGWDVSGNPVSMNDSSWPTVQYGQSGSLTVADLVGVAYDDPLWDQLLDQMTQDEQTLLVGKAMNSTEAISSIGKSVTYYMDGPQGMIDYVSGGAGYQFTDENMLGATWNKELAYRFGDLCSQEFSLKGATTWWSPAINIHRTAFSGRNFEYFSEDGIHSGLMGVQVTVAAKANGVNCQLKHFFLNDQETNRGGHGRLAPFATEQSMREIYLKPFEMCIEAVPSSGVMTSMCRIGTRIAPGHYNLLTGVLRNEWGMTGAVITDAQSLTPYEAEQALAAGCDMVCTMQQTEYLDTTLSSVGGQYALRTAVKHVLYMEVNSAASSIQITQGFPIYILLLIAYNALTVLYLGYATLEIIRASKQTPFSRKTMWTIRIVLWTVGAVILAVLLFMFFTEWLPMLQFAFQTAV